jgi:prolyl-tRNA synthetase
MVGGLIMVHGDDRGLVLPPKVAPIQAVIVPILTGKTRDDVLAVSRSIAERLSAVARVKLDDRTEVTPGWKFNDWEMRGVPLRIELGPRDLAQGQAVLVPRVGGGRRAVSLDGIVESVSAALQEVQQALFRQAKAFLDTHIVPAATREEAVAAIAGRKGFVRLAWCGGAECEQVLRRDTGASPRLISDETASAACVICGAQARQVVYYARAY